MTVEDIIKATVAQAKAELVGIPSPDQYVDLEAATKMAGKGKSGFRAWCDRNGVKYINAGTGSKRPEYRYHALGIYQVVTGYGK